MTCFRHGQIILLTKTKEEKLVLTGHVRGGFCRWPKSRFYPRDQPLEKGAWLAFDPNGVSSGEEEEDQQRRCFGLLLLLSSGAIREPWARRRRCRPYAKSGNSGCKAKYAIGVALLTLQRKRSMERTDADDAFPASRLWNNRNATAPSAGFVA